MPAYGDVLFAEVARGGWHAGATDPWLLVAGRLGDAFYLRMVFPDCYIGMVVPD